VNEKRVKRKLAKITATTTISEAKSVFRKEIKNTRTYTHTQPHILMQIQIQTQF